MCVPSSKSEDVELKSWLGGSGVKSTHCAGRVPSSVPSIHIQWLTMPPETLAQGGPGPTSDSPDVCTRMCRDTPIHTDRSTLQSIKRASEPCFFITVIGSRFAKCLDLSPGHSGFLLVTFPRARLTRLSQSVDHCSMMMLRAPSNVTVSNVT